VMHEEVVRLPWHILPTIVPSVSKENEFAERIEILVNESVWTVDIGVNRENSS